MVCSSVTSFSVRSLQHELILHSIVVNLLRFAFAGHASATLDIVDESVLRTRYVFGTSLSESRSFAKYLYKWADEYFIVYIVYINYYLTMQYILKEPSEGETIMSSNGKTDELVRAIGEWQIPPPPGDEWVYVYDGYWYRSKALYEQIKNASWDDVILNEKMKKQITNLMHTFFDSKEIYKNLGVPWKRGVIFHGTCMALTRVTGAGCVPWPDIVLTWTAWQDLQEMAKQFPSKLS